MAGRAAVAAKAVENVQPPEVEPGPVSRAFAALTSAVQKLEARQRRDVRTFDLVVGLNKIQHSLGHACVGYTVTPTVMDATFAHAINRTNTQPERELWIDVEGVDQPGAIVEVF